MTVFEFQILTDWQDKKGDRRFMKMGRDHELGAPPKHGKPKKQKLEGKAGHGPGPGPGRPKSKNLQPKIQEYEFTDDPIDVPRIPKNDAPNRFWARERGGALGIGKWRLEKPWAEACGTWVPIEDLFLSAGSGLQWSPTVLTSLTRRCAR